MGFTRRPVRHSPKTFAVAIIVATGNKGRIMTHNPFFISPADLAFQLGGASAPQIVDVRLADDHAANPFDIPGSIHRSETEVESWAAQLDCTRPVVVTCHRGFKVSQAVVAKLRARNWQASSLMGGNVAWKEAGLPLLDRTRLQAAGIKEGTVFVTRRRPKIDRAACPWLITRFIDPAATFLYVEPDQVMAVAQRTGGIPYDIPDVAISHVGEDCSFDTLLKTAGIADHAPLARLALIVRGADNARYDLAPEAAGLLAVSLGLSALAGDDDHGMIRQAFVVYDALYAWAARASGETHNWPPKA
ncbi:MAG: chromate resistance protein ChrB domain-containing protein [Beijerinckiaceae bacterium]